ncbi:MAG: hypothetical protein AAGG75_06480 [Bacteroidota bacterium]
MISRKLYTLLEQFTKYELTNFRKFLISPFFNENQELIALFDLLDHILRKDADKRTEQECSKQYIWQQLFGQRPYNDAYMRRLSSDLVRMTQQYMAYKCFKKHPLNEPTSLLEAYNYPALNKHFVGLVRQTRLTQEKLGLRNAETHYNKHLIEYYCHLHLDQLGLKRKDFENLEKSDYHLDCFYISKKLKTYCEALDYQNFFSHATNIQLFPQFLSYVEQGPYFDEPSVKVYYLVARMLQEPQKESWFQQAKDYLERHFNSFPLVELQSLYTHLKNYCIDKRINNGHSEYFAELFSIYKTSLERELLFEKGLLAPNHYKNIITVGLHIKEFDWVENFIQQYTPQLPTENQENALNYNLAKVYFHQEEYEKVIEQLREVEYKNLVYALGGKLMLLKTYYELEEQSALDSLIDSFRIYLRRNRQIARDVKQQYMNMLRFTKKLVSLPPYNRAAAAKLETQIQHCKAMTAKQWLLEKVGEMKG